MGKPIESTISFENDHSWNHEIEEFLNAVKGHGMIKEGTLDDARETQAMVQRIYDNTESTFK